MSQESSSSSALAGRLRAVEAPAVTADTSDGYHTFRELYAYRKAYNALLFNEWAERGLYDVHKSRLHSDGAPCFGGGWFIVVAQTPTGQISNHYQEADWNLFQVPERERGAEWDGHTPSVALERLLAFASALRDPVLPVSTQEETKDDARTGEASKATAALLPRGRLEDER